MTNAVSSAVEWALAAGEEEVFRALGAHVIDGAGQFSASRLAAIGRQWYSEHEAVLRAKACVPLMAVLGTDSDNVTIAYAVSTVVDQVVATESMLTPLTAAYVVGLIVRKMAAGYCDDLAPAI
ncbi:hypothetical protein [Microbacterium sp. NPDC057658]|uniref:hypothetical protein n=1 Tax=unclassified Microbacterium TaxID=2609290 RepID=UPI003672279B